MRYKDRTYKLWRRVICKVKSNQEKHLLFRKKGKKVPIVIYPIQWKVLLRDQRYYCYFCSILFILSIALSLLTCNPLR